MTLCTLLFSYNECLRHIHLHFYLVICYWVSFDIQQMRSGNLWIYLYLHPEVTNKPYLLTKHRNSYSRMNENVYTKPYIFSEKSTLVIMSSSLHRTNKTHNNEINQICVYSQINLNQPNNRVKMIFRCIHLLLVHVNSPWKWTFGILLILAFNGRWLLNTGDF